MRPGSAVLLLCVVAVGSVACSGAADPPARKTQNLISDEVHGNGTRGFFFLPPLVAHPTLTGGFQADLSPVVRIDERDPATGAVLRTVATYTTSTGPNSETVRVLGNHYLVNWHTRDFQLDARYHYRISVLVDGRVLGFIDAQVIENGQTRVVTEADHVKVGMGVTLPIKFWANRCAPVICQDADACHLAGVCDPGTGVCAQQPRPDGTACSDGDLCTQTDACQAGVCRGSNPVSCGTPPGCTTPSACEPATGMCTPPQGCARCGDGVLASGEQCDDGNNVGGDGCSAVCTREGCGDGQLQPGQVPLAVEFIWLASTCTEAPQPLIFKINGSVAISTEVFPWTCSCNPGYASWFLSDQPVLALLRSGQNTFSVEFPQMLGWATVRVYTAAGSEEFVIFDHQGGGDAESKNLDICGAGSQTDPAPQSVTAPLTFGEECDDGNVISGDGCSTVCGTEACGNGRTDFGEECDDGNQANNDGCSATCRYERCFGVSCSEDEDEEFGPPDACRHRTCNPDSGFCESLPRPDGTACNDRTVCTQLDSCQAGSCVGAQPLDCTAKNSCQNDGTCHPQRGCVVNARPDGLACNDGSACTGGDQCLGGRCLGALTPACFAAQVTPIDPTVPTTVAASTAFLYSGADAVQKGVAPETIIPVRAAVVRGRVTSRDGSAIGAVRVRVADHPEYGETFTREDGQYDLAVNGGGPLTVVYERSGFPSIERRTEVPWQGWVVLPDVVLTPLDGAVTVVQMGAATMQVARGSIVSDEDGTRRATLMFPAGTQADLQYPLFPSESVNQLSVRATEYTVGSQGPAAMPGPLPGNSGYTYAIELSADEAVASGANRVSFSNPVWLYVENFLEAPVGSQAPLGTYDTRANAWCAQQNGRVIRILSHAAGLAEVDVDGSGQAASSEQLASLAMSEEERMQLASLYPPGQSLWRVRLEHFSPQDVNMPYGLPKGFRTPSPLSERQATDPNYCPGTGSVIENENMALGESVRIVGTPLSLHYRSRRSHGDQLDRSMRLRHATLDPLALAPRSVELEVTVAGQMLRQRVPGFRLVTDPNPGFDFAWDGRDAYGRLVQGAQLASARMGFTYPIIYRTPEEIEETFAMWSSIIPGSMLDRASASMTFFSDMSYTQGLRAAPVATLGKLRASPEDLGGWTLDVQHAYDPVTRTLLRGDGEVQTADDVKQMVRQIAGYQLVGDVQSMVASPDGDIFIAAGDRRLGRVHRDGRFSLTQHLHSQPRDLAMGPDGTLYASLGFLREVHALLPPYTGGWHTVAGSFLNTASPIKLLADAIAVGRDGSLYVADPGRRQVLKKDPCGGPLDLRPVAGNGEFGTAIEEVPAMQTPLRGPNEIAIGPDDSLYMSVGPKILRVGPDGIVYRVAGTGVEGDLGDGQLATQAQIGCGCDLTVTPEGNVLFINTQVVPGRAARVRQIRPDGTIGPRLGNGFAGQARDFLSARGPLGNIISFTNLPDGTLAFSQQESLFRITAPLPGYEDRETVIANLSGSETYVFDRGGRHVRTLDALSSAIKYQFEYRPDGRLRALVDGSGVRIQVDRDAAGRPSAIVAPGGQRTVLTTDANGYLASIANPAGDTYRFTYSADGLLTRLVDPKENAPHEFLYTSAGRLRRDSDPAGGFTELSQTGDADNFTVQANRALGLTSRFAVENRADGSQVRTITGTAGLHATIATDPTGAVTLTTPDGTSVLSVPAPDPRFGLQASLPGTVRITTPGGRQYVSNLSRSATTDPGGQLSTQTDELIINGRRSAAQWDAATRTITWTSPAGRTGRTMFDEQGRVVSMRSADLAPLSASYDSRGRLQSWSWGEGARTRRWTPGYDTQDRVTSLQDPLLRQRTFAYDGANRIEVESLWGGSEISYDYDANGNVTSVSPPGRPAHLFGYTPVNLNSSYSAPGTPTALVTSYEYNANRQPIRLVKPDTGVITVGYDAAGRSEVLATPSRSVSNVYHPQTGNLVRITASDGQALDYSYDGQLITGEAWTGAVQGSLAWTYDNDFRLATEDVAGAGAVSIGYDADGLPTAMGALSMVRHPTRGLVTSTTIGDVVESYDYDEFGDWTARAARFGGTPLFTASYIRDAAGRIETKRETVGGVSDEYAYSYDAAGRLWQVMKNGTLTATYNYDANGNLTSRLTSGGAAVGVYDVQDRLTSFGDDTFSYTPNGEVATRTGPGSAVTRYTYDDLGALASVSLPDGRQVEYVQDALDRRVAKKVNGVVTRKWLYRDQATLAAELDANDQVVSRFVGGMYLVKQGRTYRLIRDHLGSVRLVVDVTSGAIEQRLEYDEVGNVLLDTNPGFQPLGYAGGLYDPDTKLVHFAAREYDPSIMRWTSRDPINLGGGTNVYRYVLDDPINFIDPLGLAEYLILVGDSGGQGKNFMNAALTAQMDLQANGDTAQIVRVSTVADFSNALAAPGPTIDGGVMYFGHSTSTTLMLGQGWLGPDSVKKLSRARLGPNAVIHLYGCNAGAGDKNIAQNLANQLQRDVYGFTKSSGFAGPDRKYITGPNARPPQKPPVYMVPRPGGTFQRFSWGGG